MSATVEQVARLEVWEGCGLTIVGWEHSKPCGCRVLEGMRLDKPGPRDLVGEPVLGFYPCDDHQVECAALHESMTLDFSDGTLHDALTERFERFIP